MTVSARAVVTAVVAALVAVAAMVGELPLALVAGALALVLAVGWPAVVDAPARRGASVVIALGGIGALVAVALTPDEPLLRGVPEVLALAVLLAFVRELVRRDGRERLVESVSGVVAGVVVTVCVAGWVAAGRASDDASLVITGAVALAVGSGLSALPLAGWPSALLTVVAAVAAGAGTGALLDLDPTAGGVVGLAVGALVAALRRLFDGLETMRTRWPALAGAVLPVAVTGIVVHVVGRVLVG